MNKTNLTLGIISAIFCFYSIGRYISLSELVKTLAESQTKISYFIIKIMNKVYIYSPIIAINMILFIAQFFDINTQLNFVFKLINGLFFIDLLMDLITNSYKNNYIFLMQKKLLFPVRVDVIFDIEENCDNNRIKNEKIYIAEKGIILYKDSNKSIKLIPKSQFKFDKDEVAFYVHQLNEYGNFSLDMTVNSFYKYPDLNEFANFFVYGAIKYSELRKFIFNIAKKIKPKLNYCYMFIYLALFIVICLICNDIKIFKFL